MEMLKDYIKRGGTVFQSGKQLIFGVNRHCAWQVIRGCARSAGLPALTSPEAGKQRGVSAHRLRGSFTVMAVQQDDSSG